MHDAAEKHGTDDHYEIVCHRSGDRAETDSAEGALLAADTLARDYTDEGPARNLKTVRESIDILVNGTYNGTLTRLARAGYKTAPIPAPTSVRLTRSHVATLDPITYPETDDLRTLDQGHGA